MLKKPIVHVTTVDDIRRIGESFPTNHLKYLDDCDNFDATL